MVFQALHPSSETLGTRSSRSAVIPSIVTTARAPRRWAHRQYSELYGYCRLVEKQMAVFEECRPGIDWPFLNQPRTTHHAIFSNFRLADDAIRLLGRYGYRRAPPAQEIC